MSIHGGEHITFTFFVYCKMDIAVTFKFKRLHASSVGHRTKHGLDLWIRALKT